MMHKQVRHELKREIDTEVDLLSEPDIVFVCKECGAWDEKWAECGPETCFFCYDCSY